MARLNWMIKMAQSIGANPKNFMGTRTNITFLGKGPTKNPLFQSPVAGLEGATEAQLGSRESIIGAVEDAMGFASANKLNSIQLRALQLNLENLHRIYNPPVLPMASVSSIRSGIKTVAPKPRSDIDRLLQEGYTDARGRRWDFPKAQGPGERHYNKLTGLNKPRLVEGTVPETGSLPPWPGAFTAALDQKTGMSRAIARQILQQDTRLKLPKEVLISLRTGSKGPDPLDLMKKYYGKSMTNYDDFLDNFPFIKYPDPEQIATRVLSEVELIPAFAHGGLARILEV